MAAKVRTVANWAEEINLYEIHNGNTGLQTLSFIYIMSAITPVPYTLQAW